MQTTTNLGNPFTSSLRVATFSIAFFDYLQTIPGEIQLYRKQIKNRRMSLVCFLFIVLRYMSFIALVLNAVGFYGSHFTLESCRRFRLAPPVTKMIAGIASQAIIFLRTWAISRKSRMVLIILGTLFVVCLPFLVIGNVYARAPFVKNGSCIAKQMPHTLNSAPMYYAAMSAFDVVACGLATYYLVEFNKASMSGFTRKVLKHGLMYAFGTTFANIIVLMALCHVKYIEKLGAFFSVAITMIMAQRLVLSTQRFSDTSSVTCSSCHDPMSNRNGPHKAFQSESKTPATVTIGGTGSRPTRTYGTDTFELGVRVQTETHMDNHLDLHKVESLSFTGASAKGAHYDLEHGSDHDEEQYGRDGKPALR